MEKNSLSNNGERGSAGTKLLLVVVVLVLAGNALINFVPVAYNGESFKQEMQTAVVQGMAVPSSVGNPLDVTKKRMKALAAKNNLPGDALIDVKVLNNVLQVHVSYRQEISLLPFGIYNYTYSFNHTATPTGFFTKETD